MKKAIIISTMLFATNLFASDLINTEESATPPSYVIMSEKEAEEKRFQGYNDEQKENFKERRRQIDAYGYYKEYSEAAVGLKEVEQRRYKGLIETADDPYYEMLRASTKGFPLNFTYAGLSSVPQDHILGYVPSGTETPDKYQSKNHLWTGVTGYFLHDTFGTCRHSVEKIGSNPTTARMYLIIKYDPNFTTYEINNKPTTKSGQGDEQSGYIYEITWTGKTYDKGLEGTRKTPFDQQAIKDLIDYAKKIDSDLPDPVK